MRQLRLKPGKSPFQVDVTDTNVERSRKGALYFFPGAIVEVTDGEAEYIRRLIPAAMAVLDEVPLPRLQPTPPSLPFVPDAPLGEPELPHRAELPPDEPVDSELDEKKPSFFSKRRKAKKPE